MLHTRQMYPRVFIAADPLPDWYVRVMSPVACCRLERNSVRRVVCLTATLRTACVRAAAVKVGEPATEAPRRACLRQTCSPCPSASLPACSLARPHDRALHWLSKTSTIAIPILRLSLRLLCSIQKTIHRYP